TGVIESTEAPARRSSSLLLTAALLVVLGAAGAAAYVFRAKIFKTSGAQKQSSTNELLLRKLTNYPIPNNVSWTLDSTKAAIPNTTAVGRIHGDGFFCERAILQGVLAHEAGAPPR